MCKDNFQEERIIHQQVWGRKKGKKREGGVFILLHLLRCTSYFPHLFQPSFLAARESSFTSSPTPGRTSQVLYFSTFWWLPAGTVCPGSCSVANGSDRNPKKCHRTHCAIPALSWSTSSSSSQQLWMPAVVTHQNLPLLQQKVTAHLPEKLILCLHQYFSLINHRERETSQQWKITSWIKTQCHFET